MKSQAPKESLELWIQESLERLEILEQHRDQLSTALDHAKGRCERLAGANQDWDGRREMLHSMQRDLDGELATAEEAVAKAERVLADARQARDELLQAKDEATHRISTLERDRHELEGSLAAAEKTRDALQISLDGMNQEIAGLYSTLEAVADTPELSGRESPSVESSGVVVQATVEPLPAAVAAAVQPEAVASQASGEVPSEPPAVQPPVPSEPAAAPTFQPRPPSSSVSGEIVAKGMWTGTVGESPNNQQAYTPVPSPDEALAAAQSRAVAAQAAAVAQAAAIAKAAATARSASQAVMTPVAVRRADTQRIVLSPPDAAWNAALAADRVAGFSRAHDSENAEQSTSNGQAETARDESSEASDAFAAEVAAQAAAIKAKPRPMRASELAARLGLKTRASAKTRPLEEGRDDVVAADNSENRGSNGHVQPQLPPPPGVSRSATPSTPW